MGCIQELSCADALPTNCSFFSCSYLIPYMLYFVLCTLYFVLYTLYFVLYTLFFILCTLYFVLCTFMIKYKFSFFVQICLIMLLPYLISLSHTSTLRPLSTRFGWCFASHLLFSDTPPLPFTLSLSFWYFCRWCHLNCFLPAAHGLLSTPHLALDASSNSCRLQPPPPTDKDMTIQRDVTSKHFKRVLNGKPP